MTSLNLSTPELELKWQKIWEKIGYNSTSIENNKLKKYILSMFPYPSGTLHIGHFKNYTITDILTRFTKSHNYNVLHPMGWDAFGLPAENAAIQNNTHPKKWTYSNISTMKEQLKRLGLSCDWSREIVTCDPSYYVNEQRFFLKMLKNDLAYQKESLVNWDPVDSTVLANEQVIDGRGWRSGALVEKKYLKQWFLRITKYANKLLDGLDHLNGWPDHVKTMQRNWIGRSDGFTIKFPLCNKICNLDCIEVFTTTPEALFGATFIALSCDHPILKYFENNREIANFIVKNKDSMATLDKTDTTEKFGMYLGIDVKHPFIENEVIPVWVANFVLSEYGSGALYGCPDYDPRDMDFANKYGLPIKKILNRESNKLTNSSFLNDFDVTEARNLITQHIINTGLGSRKTTYKLRDWGISRQRYWGCPIPVIHCLNCGVVPNHSLPVTLPEDIELNCMGNPLDNHPTWKYIKCPVCGSNAQKETDTFDTFFESSWYFLRFTHSGNNNSSDTLTEEMYWMPVDYYVGGIEHAVLHLLYSRFIVKAMIDLNVSSIASDEPFVNLFTQGMVLHPVYKKTNGEYVLPSMVIEKDSQLVERGTNNVVIKLPSEKMSKSKKNVVDADSMLNQYGADVIRLFLMSDNPPEKETEWCEDGINSCKKFLNKLYTMCGQFVNKQYEDCDSTKAKKILYLENTTILNVTNAINQFKFNKAIAHVRELYTAINSYTGDYGVCKHSMKSFETLIKLIYPITPHIAEEIWFKLHNDKNSLVCNQPWPSYDKTLAQIDETILAVQVNGKLRATISCDYNATEDLVREIAVKNEDISRYLSGKKITKVVFITNKILNFVVS